MKLYKGWVEFDVVLVNVKDKERLEGMGIDSKQLRFKSKQSFELKEIVMIRNDGEDLGTITIGLRGGSEHTVIGNYNELCDLRFRKLNKKDTTFENTKQ